MSLHVWALCGWWCLLPFPRDRSFGSSGDKWLGGVWWLSQSSTYIIILVTLGFNNKLPKMGVLKQEDFISHSSGGWEVKDQGIGRCSTWWGLCSLLALLQIPVFSLYPPHVREKRSKFSYLSSCKATNPMHKGLPSWPNYFPKVPLNPITLGVRISTYELW